MSRQDDKTDWRLVKIIYLFAGSILVLCIILLVALIETSTSVKKTMEPPKAVTAFLDEFLTDGYYFDVGYEIFPEHFLSVRPIEGSDIADGDETVEQHMFEYVFNNVLTGAVGYDIEVVNQHFSKVTPILGDGSFDYPSVGFWYTVTDGKIDTWRIGRLEPFSVYDAEYSEEYDV